MKAVKRFKNSIQHSRPPGMDSLLGKGTRMVQPPLSFSTPPKPPLDHKSRSEDAANRRPVEQALTVEGVHRDIDLGSFEEDSEQQGTGVAQQSERQHESISGHQPHGHVSAAGDSARRDLHANPEEHKAHQAATAPITIDHEGKGQARDPLSEHLYLGLGAGGSSRSPSPPTVSESPPAAESNIYETAYDQEIQRLKSLPGRSTTLFLTRRVSHKEEYRQDEDLIRGKSHDEARRKSGLARLFDQARTTDSKAGQASEHATAEPAPMGLAGAAGLVRNMMAKKE